MIGSNEFVSKDYTADVIKGGDIDSDGIRIEPMVLDPVKSEKFRGIYYRLTALMDGSEVVVQFGSKTLARMLQQNWEDIVGTEIILSGHGTGFERYYKIRKLE